VPRPQLERAGQLRPKTKDDELEAFRERFGSSPLTTDHGIPIPQTDDSLKAGIRGPSLIEDFHLREKITRFDHERIPERVVHARGSGAHGFFQVYEPLDELTSADFLQDPALKTPSSSASRRWWARAAPATSRATSAASPRVLHSGGQL
jgi:catalase